VERRCHGDVLSHWYTPHTFLTSVALVAWLIEYHTDLEVILPPYTTSYVMTAHKKKTQCAHTPRLVFAKQFNSY
jgi:hypothetical protein